VSLGSFLKTNEQYLIDAVCRVINIKSVKGEPLPGMPFGKGPARALNYVLELSKKLGLMTMNLDNYVGWAEWGQGSETIGILVHLDVVPEGRGWTYPPYGAEIHNGEGCQIAH
jgi:succinyl-diaminopimelate desuccinylase